MLLDGDRKVGAALDGGVVGDDHRLMTLNHSDAGDESGAGRLIVVHAVGGEGAEFEEWRVGIDDRVDALADKHLAAFFMAFDGSFAAALFHGFESWIEVRRRVPAWLRDWLVCRLA